MDIYASRNKYWPAYTWKMQTSYLRAIDQNILKQYPLSEKEFKSLLESIFNKINASFYHFQRLKENQEIAIETGKQLAQIQHPEVKGWPGIAAAPYEPIEYEFESFLVTVKTTLDLLALFIARCFNRKEDNIITLCTNIKNRKQEEESRVEKVFQLLKNKQFEELIGSYKDPDKKQKLLSKRNYAVHHGSLPLGITNVPINNPTASILLARALDHTDSKNDFTSKNAPVAIDYCEHQFYQLCDLLIGVLSILLNEKFQPGPKMSLLGLKILKP